jgi:hypothetical protein
MWLEAVDLVLSRLKENNCPVGEIKGISGSCQQHGSVFWNADGEPTLKGLDGAKSLHEQLKESFAYPFGPNWQDHSTQAECDLFDAYLGSPEKLAEVTGSSAHHVSLPTQCSKRGSSGWGTDLSAAIHRHTNLENATKTSRGLLQDGANISCLFVPRLCVPRRHRTHGHW